jgi:hypothetical protein
MADYYPLIKKAVERLDPYAPGDGRRALYERARAAQITQLRSIRPSLTKAEITREQLALEEAVRKVETEAAQRARDIRVPALDDLVTAAEDIGKPSARLGSRSPVVQANALANPFCPEQANIGGLPPMSASGDATGRLIRYWRWRSLPPRRIA